MRGKVAPLLQPGRVRESVLIAHGSVPVNAARASDYLSAAGNLIPSVVMGLAAVWLGRTGPAGWFR